MDEGTFSHSLHGDVVDVAGAKVLEASVFVVAVDVGVAVSSVCRDIAVPFEVSVASVVVIVVVSRIVVGLVGLVAVECLVSNVCWLIVVLFTFAVASVDVDSVVSRVLVEVGVEIFCIIGVVYKVSHVSK